MEFIPKLGMYVQCPYRLDNGTEIKLYGQIDGIYSNGKVRVRFHNLSGGQYYSSLYEKSVFSDPTYLKRVPAKAGARVKYNTKFARILPSSDFSYNQLAYYCYPLEIKDGSSSHIEAVTEDNLEIHLTSGENDPLELARERPNSDPKFFFHRSLISRSQSVIRNAPPGFKSLLGTRAYLFPHQVDTIIRAFSERPFRLMLADEVGLGKTIEAGAILKGLIESKRDTRALIIVPDTLVQQWASELWNRFFIRSIIWEESFYGNRGAGVYIVSFSILNRCVSRINYRDAGWNLLIVDEAHKLLNRLSIYDAVMRISNIAPNVLLLSATPVFRHSKENKLLLSLVNPAHYVKMSDQQFSKLVSQQSVIRDVVFSLTRDLSDYIQYDLRDEFLEKIQDIQNEIKDPKLAELITILQKQSNPNESIKTIKTILSYISEYHRIDRSVIRHRKNEIPDAHAPRRLVELVYSPAGAAEGFWEQDCLDVVSELFLSVFSNTQTEDVTTMCKRLLHATSSSPHAVLGIVRGKTNDMGPTLNRYFSLIDAWQKAYDREIEQIELLADYPERFYSKVAKVIAWIAQNDPYGEKKYLIFSEYTQTAKVYEKAFSCYFGAQTTCLFCKDMSRSDLTESVNAFQNTAECRFLICDASGGEGRNFQVADYIVHCDISWSPAVMEQRIGRLDRIGRKSDKEVTSVVIHSEYGVENDLFQLYNNGLNVFCHSLCGMEIAFEEIQTRIDKAFTSDPVRGLKESLPDIAQFASQIEAEVEQERYFDMARQLDESTTEQLEKLVRFFSLEDEKPLTKALSAWASKVGIPTKLRKMTYDGSSIVSLDLANLDQTAMCQNSYVLPFRPDRPIILGTFSREAAIRHERLYFLAPSNALYDSLAKNAEESERNMVSAIHFDCGMHWEGFYFVWNINYDYSSIIEKNLPSESLSVLSRFLPVGQVSVFVENPSLRVENDEAVLSVLYDCVTPGTTRQYQCGSWGSADEEEWASQLSQACQRGEVAALIKYNAMMDIPKARDFFEMQLAASTAQKLRTGGYVPTTWINTQGDIDLFLRGMESPIFELDSVAYITTD